MEKVLIVDDDYQFGCSLKALLSYYDIEAMYHYDAYGAMESLQRERCDIAIIDLDMPQMDGITLAQFLIKKYPAIIIVLMTEGGRLDDYIEPQTLGIMEFLYKPIDLNMVTKMIKDFRDKKGESQHTSMNYKVIHNKSDNMHH